MNDSAAPLNNGARPKLRFPKPPEDRRPTPNQHRAAQKARMRWFTLAAIALGIVNAPMLLATPVGQRGLLAGAIGGMLLMLLMKSPRDGVVLALFYLGVVGGLRRWLIPIFGWAPQDPLVLVQAAVIGGSFLFLLLTRRLNWDTVLSRCLGCLLGIMALEVFNPAQGGIAIGIAGVLFIIVPALWYYAGRRLGTPLIVVYVMRAALTLSLIGALYGLYQTWFGFSQGELIWMRITRNPDIRSFSFFTTVAEYGMFLSVGVAILWAAFLRGNRAAFLPIHFLAIALLFLSERGVVIGTLFICAVLWAVQGRNRRIWLPRALLAMALAGIGLVWTLQQAQHVTFSGNTQELVEHQTSGILNPGSSTAPIHATMMSGGLLEGVQTPLGHGLGAASGAADKFGKGSVSSETDWTDSFITLGIFGGLLYTFMIGLILLTAVREWIRSRSFVALAVLGILLAGIGHWLHGGYYAISMLMWFMIGALDRAARLAQTEATPAVSNPAVSFDQSPASRAARLGHLGPNLRRDVP